LPLSSSISSEKHLSKAMLLPRLPDITKYHGRVLWRGIYSSLNPIPSYFPVIVLHNLTIILIGKFHKTIHISVEGY